jgi:hypothetical protein
VAQYLVDLPVFVINLSQSAGASTGWQGQLSCVNLFDEGCSRADVETATMHGGVSIETNQPSTRPILLMLADEDRLLVTTFTKSQMQFCALQAAQADLWLLIFPRGTPQ